MPEIVRFKISEAYAELFLNGIKVTLVYPSASQREYFTKRRYTDSAAIEFGVNALERLLRGDRVRIGTPEYPSRPASGGIIDVLCDDSFFVHRRDGGTKVHPWY